MAGADREGGTSLLLVPFPATGVGPLMRGMGWSEDEEGEVLLAGVEGGFFRVLLFLGTLGESLAVTDSLSLAAAAAAATEAEAAELSEAAAAAAAAANAAAAEAGMDEFFSDWLRPLTCRVSANFKKSFKYDSCTST